MNERWSSSQLVDARQQRGVGPEALARRGPEQLPRRLARGLAADVPERDVERSQRVHDRAAAAGHRGADVELVPDRHRVERVEPDQRLRQAEIHRVRAGRLDAGARHPGVEVGLADAADALVGVHLDDDVVLVAAGRVALVGRIEQDVAVDARDLHCGSVSTT